MIIRSRNFERINFFERFIHKPRQDLSYSEFNRVCFEIVSWQREFVSWLRRSPSRRRRFSRSIDGTPTTSATKLLVVLGSMATVMMKWAKKRLQQKKVRNKASRKKITFWTNKNHYLLYFAPRNIFISNFQWRNKKIEKTNVNRIQ